MKLKGKFLCGNDKPLKISIVRSFGNKFFSNSLQIYIIKIIVHRVYSGNYLNRIFLFIINN